MKIVIDIDDKVYGLLRYFEKSLGLNDKKDDSDDVKTALMRAVINGTPLPKGHGKLGDLDALREEVSSWGMNDYEPSDFTDAIDQADAIIEADKGE